MPKKIKYEVWESGDGFCEILPDMKHSLKEVGISHKAGVILASFECLFCHKILVQSIGKVVPPEGWEIPPFVDLGGGL